MSVLAGFLDHVGRLVHESVRSCEVERARHRTFLLSRFALFVAAAGAMVVTLASGHAPAGWETLALGWATLPLGAGIYVARTGRLDRGEAMCLAAWWGLALTTTLSGVVSLVGGCILLLVAPLEAALAHRRGLVNASIAVACVSILLLGVCQASGMLASGGLAPARGDAVVALPALLFIVVLARCSLAVHHRRERALALGEEQYRVLSDVIGDVVLRCDRSGAVARVSRDAERMLQVPARDLLGRGFLERIHAVDRPAFLAAFADAAESRDRKSARLRFRVGGAEGERSRDGAAFLWLEIRARRLQADDGGRGSGKAAAVVAVVRDITAQIEHEQAIERAKDDAERHSHWKDSFLANVSHELRTPLNAIIGFSEMLGSAELSPGDPAKRREYAGIITSSGQHLLAVVNSLLDISKIDAGRFDLNPEPFAVDSMVASCCAMVGLKADQAEVAIRQDLAADLGELIGDKRACKQILINLLSNAIKFTPEGGVVLVSARREGGSCVLAVADTGIGIAAGDLKRLGDAFYQAHTGHNRPFEGTGLGLSVVRGLVGLHGGSVSVASAPGQGTTVTVRLPLDCRHVQPVDPAAKIETFAGHNRVLVPIRLPVASKVQKVA